MPGVEVPGMNGVSNPTLMYSLEPSFSEEARKLKKGGTALLGLIMDAEGNPTKIHVLQMAGLGLDEQALDAVTRYLFKPSMKEGKRVPVRGAVQVNFRRDGWRDVPLNRVWR